MAFIMVPENNCVFLVSYLASDDDTSNNDKRGRVEELKMSNEKSVLKEL